jgi:hypothetical protein
VSVVLATVLASVPPVQLATTRSAAAAVQGHVIVRAVSVSDSTDVKSATAFCPSSDHAVISGGGRVVGADGHVILQRLVPVNGPIDRYFATAAEDTVGFAGDWSVEAYAVCVEGISGLRIVSGFSRTLNAGYENEVRVDCPDGRNLTGVGAETSTVYKGVSFDWIRPDEQGHYMIAKAKYDGRQLPEPPDLRYPTVLPAFHIFGYAICAWAADGYEVRAVGSPALMNVPVQQMDATCPFPKVLYGAGLTKTDYIGDVHVDAMFPSSTDRATTIARKTWTIGAWALGAWAICGH